MTNSELVAIESRANAATPGPWVTACDAVGHEIAIAHVFGSTEYIYADVGFIASRRGDAEFIAAARGDVVTLVAEVRRLQSELDKDATVSDWLREQAAKDAAEIEHLQRGVRGLEDECRGLRRRNEALANLLSIASDAVTSLEEADYFATAAKLRDALRAFGRIAESHLGACNQTADGTQSSGGDCGGSSRCIAFCGGKRIRGRSMSGV